MDFMRSKQVKKQKPVLKIIKRVPRQQPAQVVKQPVQPAPVVQQQNVVNKNNNDDEEVLSPEELKKAIEVKKQNLKKESAFVKEFLKL